MNTITLKSKDVEVQLLNVGASIYKVKTKNKNGEFKNICLTHSDIDEYTNGNEAYFGVTAGRFAGRIRDAKFELGGKTYELSKNFNGKHSLHGGNVGFSHRVWAHEVFEDENISRCVFTYNSPHLEEGFPGNVKAKVEYVLENNILTINYSGTSDCETYLNLTNHSYFNLSDEEDCTVSDHVLQLNSTKHLLCDEDVIPTGIAVSKGTEFDFQNPRAFGDLSNKKDSILKAFGGYDNCFALDKNDKCDLFLKDEKSGRTLSIETTYPCVVIYTYNFPKETKMIGRLNKKHMGVAIEPQYAPNAMKDDNFFIPITSADKPYKESIKYTFNK